MECCCSCLVKNKGWMLPYYLLHFTFGVSLVWATSVPATFSILLCPRRRGSPWRITGAKASGCWMPRWLAQCFQEEGHETHLLCLRAPQVPASGWSLPPLPQASPPLHPRQAHHSTCAGPREQDEVPSPVAPAREVLCAEQPPSSTGRWWPAW